MKTLVGLMLGLLSTFVQVPKDASGTCLLMMGKNLVNGGGNWYAYVQFSEQKLVIREGDSLVYSILLDERNPEPKGGIDIDFDDSTSIRDKGLLDSDGVRVHGDGLLNAASGKWLTRHISLDKVKGRTAKLWSLVFEGDTGGEYAQFVSDIKVQHKDGTETVVYAGGEPTSMRLLGHNGYSTRTTCFGVPKPANQAEVVEVLRKAAVRYEKSSLAQELASDSEVVIHFLSPANDQGLIDAIKASVTNAQKLAADPDTSTNQVQDSVLEARKNLAKAKPILSRYTGHFVGHGHIDPQWLWDWNEGIQVTHDTFNQALKFMDEFPTFTYTQSSASLYLTMEKQYPELFAGIQRRVKEGRWELVGGRMVEADTNVISSESHARHFLYAQTYFREKFGKIATVGWEPDTFGHNAQMPQIEKLGGCDSYYFCRGGQNKPLFWWLGLDGTKILAYDEAANGSWYGGDITRSMLDRMLTFEKATGAKDSLLVYGVGNHGGGPTREHIVEGLRWSESKYLPTTRFSTVTSFFKKVRNADLSKLPAIHGELEKVFEGCYSSHADIKRLNHDAEATTGSAEAAASIAWLFGAVYPQQQFKDAWHEILLNHHHDTIGGSGVGASYVRTRDVLGKVVLAQAKQLEKSVQQIAKCLPKGKAGEHRVVVFNPNGTSLSGYVSAGPVMGTEGVILNPAASRPDLEAGRAGRGWVAVAPDGKAVPCGNEFWATDVPAFGYRVYRIVKGKSKADEIKVSKDKLTMENRFLAVTFDKETGAVKHLVDKSAGKDLVPKGGLIGVPETVYEKPGGMNAWLVGVTDKIVRMKVMRTYWRDDLLCFDYVIPGSGVNGSDSKVTVRFSLGANDKLLNESVEVVWKALGTGQTNNPTLALGFDSPAQKPVARYEIPFGNLVRPVDGAEVPALRWSDFGDDKLGITIVNNGAYGHWAKGKTLGVRLIRSSFDPDPNPNPGFHAWKFAILPRTEPLHIAEANRAADALNTGLVSQVVPAKTTGVAPSEFTALSLGDPNLLSTSLKLSESGDGLVVRFFEGTGKQAKAVVKSGFPVTSAVWVNFIEDAIGAAKLAKGSLASTVRGFEIRTLKLRTQQGSAKAKR